ncbi:MAG TPA: Hint domain-containing protein [Acetobacteraceae bacterium]|nr:Hint domain-containing protein [Acetobacteraceae bacterium]
MLTSRTGFIAYQADVEMPLGGSFTNASGAYVKNGVFMNAGGETGASAILVDAGTITDGIGMNEESSNGVPIHEGTGTVILSGTVSGGASDPIPIYFGGSYALLVLQHGYAIGGVAEAGGTNPHVIQLLGSAGAPVTVNFNPSSFSNFGTVAFAAGSGTYGTLAVAASADVPGTIAGFTGPHDVIDLGFIGDTNHDATAVLNPLTDQLTVTGDNGSTVLQLASGESYPLFQAIPDAAGTGTDVETICFCRGTRIMTEHGEVEVEHLRIGDRVTLFDGGSAPIRWIGEAQVLATRGRRDAATPVIIRKGALEDNVPNHDLRVTKAHSLYLDAVLIPVEFLVNHRSILWDDHAQEVAIYHVELPEHGVLFANGAPAESYRDDGNRWLFRNADSGRHLPPMPPCAPVLTGGAKVDTVWRRLLDRCRPRHELPLTDDPDLHLMVDGSRLQPRRTEGRDHIFHLPDAAACICIASRSAVPQEMGFARDPRNLGVAVARITARQGSRLRIIEADHPMLDTGFHAFECDNGFRWTAGDAVIPSAVLADFRGPVELVLSIASTTHYPDDGARLAAA